MQSFGEKMRSARHKAGINAYQFAESLGVSKSMLSAWESGALQPSLVKRMEIAKKLRFHLQVTPPTRLVMVRARPWAESSPEEVAALIQEDPAAFVEAGVAIAKSQKAAKERTRRPE